MAQKPQLRRLSKMKENSSKKTNGNTRRRSGLPGTSGRSRQWSFRRTNRQWKKSDEDLIAQRKRPGKREREAMKRKEEASNSNNPIRLVEAPMVRQPPPPPQSPRNKTSEEVQQPKPREEVKQAAVEEEKAAPPKVAKTEELQSSSYYSSEEQSEEEQEVVLKGKANSPAKTFIGEMPSVLNLETPKSDDRVGLLKKGSYRAVYQHPTDQKLVWKVADHGEEAAWLRLYGGYTMPKLGKKIPVRVKLTNSKFPESGKGLRILEVEKWSRCPSWNRPTSWPCLRS